MVSVDAWMRRQDGRWLFPVFLGAAVGLFRVLLNGLGVAHEQPFSWAAAIVFGLCLACPAIPQCRERFRHLDWRIALMVLATLFAVGLTLVGFDEGWHEDTYADHFVHDVFAGWTASVVFFALIGLLVAGVPVARPEHGGFNSRARILFRGEDGPHIDYIVAQLSSTLAHYAEQLEMTVVVRGFDSGSQRFFTSTEIKTTLKSWLDDVATKYESKIELIGATDPPTGGAPNRLTHLVVGGQSSGHRGFVGGDLIAPIEAITAPYATCLVDSGYDLWVQAGSEPYSYEAARFTRRCKLTVCNRTPGGQALQLRLSRDRGNRFVSHQLANGEARCVFEDVELKPGVALFDLRLDGLT